MKNEKLKINTGLKVGVTTSKDARACLVNSETRKKICGGEVWSTSRFTDTDNVWYFYCGPEAFELDIQGCMAATGDRWWSDLGYNSEREGLDNLLRQVYDAHIVTP